jgi:hypothetical protein
MLLLDIQAWLRNHVASLLVHAGVDCQVKVWDVRTFKPLHAYFANSPATSLDISQRGLLAVGQGRRLQVGAIVWV